nr:family 78 glycoside hydrolase catalytic domain [Curtobacterium sp. PhB130]
MRPRPPRRARTVLGVLLAAVVVLSGAVTTAPAFASTVDPSGSTASPSPEVSEQPTDPDDPGAPTATPTPDVPTPSESPTPSATATPTPEPTTTAPPEPTPTATPTPEPTPASRPTALRVNGATSPMAVDPSATVRFSWVPDAAVERTYRIVVATSPAAAAAGTGDVWDSGNVTSAATQNVPYRGPRLANSARYWFSVQSTGDDRPASPWATPSTFGTTVSAWSAKPIWSAKPTTAWQSYTVDATVTVDAVAMGVVFRAKDARNGYLWQFRADNDTLVPHVQRNGAYRALPAIRLANAGVRITRGSAFPVRIVVTGNRIVTSVRGTVVDDRRDSTFTEGWVGVRTGASERGSITGLRVTSSDGAALWSASGTTSTPDLPCTTLKSGRTTVGVRANCVYDAWANYTVHATVMMGASPTGIVLRASDDANGYLWQFDTATSTLRPHVQVHGSYRLLKTVSLKTKVLKAHQYAIRIQVQGSTIRTWFAGRLVDTRTDKTFSRGLVGFRTSTKETVQANVFTVTAPSGLQVYAKNSARTDMSCATLSATGVLSVPKGSRCLIDSAVPDWTFARTSFTLPAGKIRWATVWSTGSSPAPTRQYVYRLSVNGSFAAAGPVRPIGTEVRYDSTDVTSLLHAGQRNALAALAYTTADRRLLVQLVVTYEDGTRVVIGSGSSWRTLDGTGAFRPGASVGTGYYVAPSENIDAARYPDGWDTAAFDDSSWRAAEVRPTIAALTASPLVPIVETTHAVRSTVRSASGTLVVDFGRTWMGGISLAVSSSAARNVTVTYGETLTSAKTIAATTTAGNRWVDSYRLRPGKQTIAGWGLRVFRYVQITGLPSGVTASAVRAVALHSPIGTDADFDSSNATLDAVRDLSATTIESTTLGMYVDSWERERAPYEADAYIEQLAQAALDTDSAAAAYTSRWLLANATWPTEWPLFDALAVHARWMETGDTTEISANWAALQKTLLTKYIDTGTGLVRHDSSKDIVDWPGAERDGYVFTTTNTVVNALTYRDLVVMSELATAIGRTADAATYTKQAAALRTAINARLWDPTKRAYRDGLTASGGAVAHWAVQASAFALAAGVADTSTATRAAAYVAGRGMACSVYCAAFLVPGLFANGQATAATAMLTSTGKRSWSNMIRVGAGATMEAWDLSLKANTTYSHPWAASPASIVVSSLVGLRATTPSWSTFEVAPEPGGIANATLARPTVRGTIRAGYAIVGSGVDVAVSVPATTRASVRVPGTSSSVWVDGVSQPATRTGGDAVVEVGPGCHTVSVGATPAAVLRGVCR